MAYAPGSPGTVLPSRMMSAGRKRQLAANAVPIEDVAIHAKYSTGLKTDSVCSPKATRRILVVSNAARPLLSSTLRTAASSSRPARRAAVNVVAEDAHHGAAGGDDRTLLVENLPGRHCPLALQVDTHRAEAEHQCEDRPTATLAICEERLTDCHVASRSPVGDAVHTIGLQRLSPSSQLYQPRRHHARPPAERTSRHLRDEDGGRHGLRELLQPRGHVHRVSDDRVLSPLRRADRAQHHRAGMDADGHVERGLGPRRAFTVPARELLLHREGTSYGPRGMIRLGDGCAEVDHEPVTEELVERAAEREDRSHHPLVVGVQERDDLGPVEPLGERGEVAQVAEEHGHPRGSRPPTARRVPPRAWPPPGVRSTD